MSDTTVRTPTRADAVTRYLPLTGVGYAVLVIAGYLTIGDFPDGETSPSGLVSYYASHHADVGHGGRLLEWSAVALALFAVALSSRARSSGVWATVILVGGTMDAIASATSGATYTLLGDASTGRNLDPAALQAWHLSGSEFGVGAGLTLMLLGVLMASVTTRAVPAWLGWSGAVLGVAQLTMFGFFASLAFLLWCVAAGIVLTARPGG
jgi:hypothetical protein